MNDPTPELQPSVSQVLADALRLAADGLARWLELPVDAKELGTTRVNLDAAKASFANLNDVLCCCTMPVDLVGPPQDLANLCASTLSAKSRISAGQLVLAWDLPDAMWLVDRSLHESGTSEDQSTWGSLQWSAIAETSNIVGCEFLNSIAEGIQLLSNAELELIPHPPQITQQTGDSLIHSAVISIDSHDNGSPDQKIWMVTGTFKVADHPIHTRMAMVWCPRVWKCLSMLVHGSSSGGA